MSLNIFEIWDKIGRQTPFAVIRDHWNEGEYAIVENIDCVKMPYGKAFGYPIVKGEISNRFEYDKQWQEEKLIPCCGCYQWRLAENVEINKGKSVVEKSSKKAKAIACSFDSIINFGKFKGLTLEKIFKENPQYILWAIVNIERFYLTTETITHLEKLVPDFKFADGIKKLNDHKLRQNEE